MRSASPARPRASEDTVSADKKRLPWYQDGIRFECQQTGGCCTNHGDYAYVYLSPDDEARMVAELGLGKREFRRRYTRLLEGYRVLRSKDGGCIFLEGHACTAYAARPVQCRTWPFWPDTLDERAWKEEVAPFCKGVGKGRLWTREEIEAIAEQQRKNEDKQ